MFIHIWHKLPIWPWHGNKSLSEMIVTRETERLDEEVFFAISDWWTSCFTNGFPQVITTVFWYLLMMLGVPYFQKFPRWSQMYLWTYMYLHMIIMIRLRTTMIVSKRHNYIPAMMIRYWTNMQFSRMVPRRVDVLQRNQAAKPGVWHWCLKTPARITGCLRGQKRKPNRKICAASIS